MSVIRIKIGDQVIQIDPRFAKVSGLLGELQKQSDEEEVFELSAEYVGLEQFAIIRKYYEQNNFEPPNIELRSDDPSKVFNGPDFELIMKYNPLEGKELLKLIQSAIYLNMHHFKRLCIARIALEFFVDRNNPQPYLEKLSKRYPHVPQLTLKDVETYRLQYPFLFGQYF